MDSSGGSGAVMHSSSRTRQVWRKNLSAELEMISTCLQLSYSFVAIDAGFPGFLRHTPRDASEEERYCDLKFNVDRTHLLHLGISLFNSAGEMPFPGCHWQINFCDLGPDDDACSSDLTDVRRRSGHGQNKNRRQGVNPRLCSECSLLFRNKIFNGTRHGTKFITFHGMYDVAYVVKLITGAPLPETSVEFLLLARSILGDFCDVKHMAGFCRGLRGGELSLMKLADLVLGDEKPQGMWHQSGYDSLLTGAVYHRMKKMYNIDTDKEKRLSSVLYGLEEGSAESKRVHQETDEAPLLPRSPLPTLPLYAMKYFARTGLPVFHPLPLPSLHGAPCRPVQAFQLCNVQPLGFF